MNTTAATNMNVAPGRSSFWVAFRQMPLVVQAYAGFALVVLVVVGGLGTLLSLVPYVHGSMRPWTGPILFGLYFATISILLNLVAQRPRRRLLMVGLFILLACLLLAGIGDTLRLVDATTVTLAAQTTNPTLQYHPFRPVINVTVPAFWILMLLSPQVRCWMKTSPEEGPVPFSLVDLFHWVFVAAVCTALSIALVGFARNRLEVGQTLAEMLAKSKAASLAPPSPTKTP